MPTFGNTNTEASNLNLDDTIYCGRFTMGAIAGEGDSISMYLDSAVMVGSQTHPVRAAIYTDVADPVLVGQTNELIIDEDLFTDGWYTCLFGTKPALAASTSYLIAGWSDNFSGTCRIRNATSGGSGVEYQVIDYSTAGGAFPDPLVNTVLGAARLLSIYCTYTEVTGQPTTKRVGGVQFARGDNGLFGPRRF
jgi:hypothetical protein